MAGSVPATSTVPLLPLPRRPSDPQAPDASAVRRWYENELGWPTLPGDPPLLRTGVRFDVLDVPAEAGAAALRHLAPGSPVALYRDRLLLLVAEGSAEELPGLLEWLEWGALRLDLRALGAGGLMAAPGLPGAGVPGARVQGAGVPGASVQGAAVWVRPPGPGGEVEASLPTLASAMGGPRGAPDLVRLVDTVAAGCHRIRLRRACARPSAGLRNQPLAFS